MIPKGARFAWVGLAMLGLSACEDVSRNRAPEPQPQTAAPLESSVQPQSRPATDMRPVQSEYSLLLSQYYRRLQNEHLQRGLMRTDGGGTDTPFTDTQLARNFQAIAMFDEYDTTGGGLQQVARESRLRRWESPVRFGIEFGAGTPEVDRTSDTAFVRNYAATLAAATGHDISVAPVPEANFFVLFLSEEERLSAASRIRQLVPGISEGPVRYAVNLPREQLCIVIGTFGPDGYTYSRAVAIIRSEHPTLMRQSCVHEELAQGLGLSNDSPYARPSIFNDDDEFGLLTRHDRLLLKILYDRRLTAGMTADQTEPIVRQIAIELTGGPV